MEDAIKREVANTSRRSDISCKSSRSAKSYGKSDAARSKNKDTKSDDMRVKRSRDDDKEKTRKKLRPAESSNKSHDTSRRESTQTQKSLPSQSAIRTKDSKRPRSTSNVRFDQSATRPKLDIFGSNVHGKSKEKPRKSSKSSRTSSSKPSTQTSGISSSESGVRRRKKAPSKNKASSLALVGFDDDAGFL